MRLPAINAARIWRCRRSGWRGFVRRRLTRIGLSATQEPVAAVADYLVGAARDKPCAIVNSGHVRERDIQLELGESKLEAVLSGEAWGEIYARLADLIRAHRTTLIFVQTRRMAERMAKALSERLDGEFGEQSGERITKQCNEQANEKITEQVTDNQTKESDELKNPANQSDEPITKKSQAQSNIATVTAHHGSLAKEHRLDAEQRLKAGTLRALVATASLELGIDIGEVDLVCQVGSPRGISVFLQRIGRSGHQVCALPKGRLFPLSRDDLVECAALIDAVNRGALDRLRRCPAALDVLAQQLIAEVAGGECTLDSLYEMVRRAQPYRDLSRAKFDEVIQMLADGFSTRRGRKSAYLHLDAVAGKVRPRRAARLTALTCGGTIADQFDYDVILEPGGYRIGTLNEDFSFESLPGDIFQLGNAAYRILKVELGKVFVADAAGQPPTIPFWFGNAAGRSDELSEAVSELRRQVAGWLPDGTDATKQKVITEFGLTENAASQLTDYLGAAWSALGALPTLDTVIFERFFDEAGDQHLVVHSTFRFAR